MHRRQFLMHSSLGLFSLVAMNRCKTMAEEIGPADNLHAKPEPFLFDMVHENPGEADFASAYLEPEKLRSLGYNGKVFFLFEAAQFGISWRNYDLSIYPDGCDEILWQEKKYAEITAKYDAAQRAGLAVYCMMDMIVLPRLIVDRYKSAICTEDGKIDIHRSKTQELISYLLDTIFKTFPQLAGLIIRTGETYLHDAPHFVGNDPILKGADSQIALIRLLQKEICDKRAKRLFYRTWGFDGFHSNPAYYLKVTDQVDPHPLLIFSIKHTQYDFWRIEFNPTLAIGKHKQIVEVQCQREYEGKSAHPNYIGKGLIDGFTESMGTGKNKCLRDIINQPHFSGLWTWSRGGGWSGPYIRNELWADLNVEVISKWILNPHLSEEEVFKGYAASLGFAGADIDRFRRIALLSADAIYSSQYSKYGMDDLLWTRDNVIGGVSELRKTFDRALRDNTGEKYLAEKSLGTKLWKEIETLAFQIQSGSEDTKAFIRTSCTYGRIKHEIFEMAWIVLFIAYQKEQNGNGDIPRIRAAISAYDRLWDEWRSLGQAKECPSIYLDTYSNGRPGVGESVNRYRRL